MGDTVYVTEEKNKEICMGVVNKEICMGVVNKEICMGVVNKEICMWVVNKEICMGVVNLSNGQFSQTRAATSKYCKYNFQYTCHRSSVPWRCMFYILSFDGIHLDC